MRTQDQILETLREFVTRQFPAAAKQGMTADQPLLSSGVIDSMGTMEVVMFLESTFDIVLSDDEMLDDNFETLQRMTDFVVSKLDHSLTVESPA